MRFRIDKNSVRGVYSTTANIRHYTILADGRDHGIVLRDAGWVEGHSIIINGETVVSGLSESDAVPWLENNLTELPPLRTEQFSMEL